MEEFIEVKPLKNRYCRPCARMLTTTPPTPGGIIPLCHDCFDKFRKETVMMTSFLTDAIKKAIQGERERIEKGVIDCVPISCEICTGRILSIIRGEGTK